MSHQAYSTDPVENTAMRVAESMDRFKESLLRQIRLGQIEMHGVDLAGFERDGHNVLMHLLMEHSGRA